VYVDRFAHIRFRNRKILSVTFGAHSAAIRGIGWRNGRRVRYLVGVVDRGRGRRDTFSILLDGGYRNSGRLRSGNIVIR
jgi:hypothetical protein